MTAPPTPPSRAITLLLALIASVAIVVPALVAAFPPDIPAPLRLARPPQRVVPKAELPPVEPMAFQALDPAAARAFNATVPFSTAPNPPARPFRVAGRDEDKARAIDCMAAAMLYEAGDDPVGERAVGQVVINRVRHPAFPKSICGVVFQGQERRTGCQFTFTCDGALARIPDPLAWERARRLAIAALTGAVVAKVGHSTHYHTDWVVPYWQSSLDKVAEVHTHLFFRWTGWWGTPPAFRRTVSLVEPLVEKLAFLSDAHKTPEALAAMASVALPDAAAPPPLADDPDAFLVTLDPKLPPDLYLAAAQRACGEREHCKYMAWKDAAKTPAALPLGPLQVATMTFGYLRDRSRGFEKPLWNCATFKRADPRECMKEQFAAPQKPVGDVLPNPAAARATLGLPAVTPKASPTPPAAPSARSDPPPPTPTR